MHGGTTNKHAYVGAIQLNALAAVVLVASMTPEALHLSFVDGRGVIYLQGATSAADHNRAWCGQVIHLKGEWNNGDAHTSVVWCTCKAQSCSTAQNWGGMIKT